MRKISNADRKIFDVSSNSCDCPLIKSTYRRSIKFDNDANMTVHITVEREKMTKVSGAF